MKTLQERLFVALALALLGAIICLAQSSKSTAGKIQKPSFANAGGPQPSNIQNGETVTIKLPGAHFTGATLRSDGDCRLVSYKVISDNEIQAVVQGARAIEDRNEYCNFSVRNSAGSASAWIVVSLTEAQEQEKKQRDQTAGEAKIKAMASSAGTEWRIHFADGTEITYRAKGSNADGMPSFLGTDGQTIGILVRPDHSVYIIEQGCILNGWLRNGQVKDGTVMPGCPHTGPCTATVQN